MIDDTNLEVGEVHRDWLDDDDRGVLIDVVFVGCWMFPAILGRKGASKVFHFFFHENTSTSI